MTLLFNCKYQLLLVLLKITNSIARDACFAFDIERKLKGQVFTKVAHKYDSDRNLFNTKPTTIKKLTYNPTLTSALKASITSLTASTNAGESLNRCISLEIESSLQSLHVNASVKILSTDPLIYIVQNFLSTEECASYQKHVQHLQNVNDREKDGNTYRRCMTRSNPPELSLDVRKLWPLPILSLISGIPPYLRLMESTNTMHNLDAQTIMSVVLPAIIKCLISMVAMGYFLVIPLLRYISNNSSRTSDAIALNEEEDMSLIHPLVVRTTATVKAAKEGLMYYTWENWEAPVVTRYNIGSIFAKHGDASPTRGSEWINNGGQRLVTCICYLNTLSEGSGGETYFDLLNIKVRPEMGKALFFYPADSVSWDANDRTVHESLPPKNNEKWIVQMFGRAKHVPPPLGLPYGFKELV